MKSPLDTLAKCLSEGRIAPFDWIVEHAADGRIDALWDACEDSQTLLAIYSFTPDRKGFVKAVCACTRTALWVVPAEEMRPQRAIEAAEAWTRGETAMSEVRRAAYGAQDSAESTHNLTGYAAYAAYCAARSVDGAPTYGFDAIEYTLLATGARSVTLARIVRSVLDCPSIGDLHGAGR